MAATSDMMKAVGFRPSSQTLAVEYVTVPKPGPKQILVKVQTVALNSVDGMNVDHPIALQDMRVVGTDFAGVALALLASSANDRPGAYAEYVVADYDLTWKVGVQDMNGNATERISWP
ncbi:uncharacterized protein N7469_001663 [Penicillium citrinum]|uniref:Uncharacterized protein n=1 Tax=Penicillium citrinum TaxID=5077 RepID=A0A9W9PF66_PENCI|nr:uncharacterized protein N7469_001663 [Penicillium citrinum]KAJ5243336.1 hypothetical protein N7469_001663 [Penicillium citrinum]